MHAFAEHGGAARERRGHELDGGDRQIGGERRQYDFSAGVLRGHDYSASTLCTSWTQTEPSPTAAATRFTLFARTSPTANTPGRLVSKRNGRRAAGQRATVRSAGTRSGPVLTNPL